MLVFAGNLVYDVKEVIYEDGCTLDYLAESWKQNEKSNIIVDSSALFIDGEVVRAEE